MHFADMHQVTGQPQTRMVVHIAIEIQLAHRLVDNRYARGTASHILRYLPTVRVIRQHAFMQILMYGFAQQ